MSEANFARELGIEPANLKSVSQIEHILLSMLTPKQAQAVYSIKLLGQNVADVADQMKVTPTQVNMFIANGMGKLKSGNRQLAFVQNKIKHAASQKR